MSDHKILSDENIDLATEYAEFGIDRLIDNEIIRDLPGIKTVIGVLRIPRSIRDFLFIRKVKKFIDSVDQFSDMEREQFARKFDYNPKARTRLADALLLILDQLDDLEKAILLARAFSALVRGEINSYLFRRYGEIIKAANITHLRNLYQTIQNDTDSPDTVYNHLSDQVLPLSSLGLVELSEPPPPQNTPTKRASTTYYWATEFGRRFVRTIIRPEDLKEDDEEGDDERAAR
jgi:hypothetical protein